LSTVVARRRCRAGRLVQAKCGVSTQSSISHLSAVVLIRQRRAELGLSQAEVAKRADVSQQQIARLENPRTPERR